MPDPQPLDYARERSRQRRSPIERAFVILVIADTIAFGPAITILRCLPAGPETVWLRSASGAVVTVAWGVYALLCLAGLFILLATRRQDHGWAFSLSVLFSGIMVFVGFCAGAMSH